MKPSVSLLALVLAGLTSATGLVLADYMAAPNAAAILETEKPPALLKYINDKENIPREFDHQPPLVPHTTNKPITLRENECLECHMKQPGEEKAQSVEMSESHFIDREGKKLNEFSKGRYFCTQCHVPQVKAKPLVESSFKSVAAN